VLKLAHEPRGRVLHHPRRCALPSKNRSRKTRRQRW
jgi:hypothetical protein